MFIHEPVELKYGDLVCETLPTGRTYLTPEKRKYPSITTVLAINNEDHIREWRARVGEEEANRVSRVAAKRGDTAHTIVERFIKNQEVKPETYMPNAWASFKAIRPVLEKRLGKIFLQEKPLYSDHLGVAGRVDLIPEWDGKRSIVDIKTSSRVKTKEDISNYFMQEAAYAIMFEERTGLPVTQLVTVMAVDFMPEPLIFIEHRDNWTKQLLETISEYRRRKMFGH
jgi:genome maintenance exonuclease 1